ncbi:MAG: hypothetical protein K2H85_09155, partial [Allobaculum sp.]|nr:hypothetical protein [Allobaculum sp.]
VLSRLPGKMREVKKEISVAIISVSGDLRLTSTHNYVSVTSGCMSDIHHIRFLPVHSCSIIVHFQWECPYSIDLIEQVIL